MIAQTADWWDPAARQRLAYRVWAPESVRRWLLVLHGFGEHGGRYEAFAQALAEQGIGVIAPDLWGHGRSDGRRGDLDLTRTVDDLAQWAEDALPTACRERLGAVFGHSAGGLLAITWALRFPRQVPRLVIQSPLLAVGFRIPRWKTALARLVIPWWPGLTLTTGLDLSNLAHDPAVMTAYLADPLTHRRMSARAYQSVLSTADTALAEPSKVAAPTLLLCGSDDHLISVPTARQWFRRLTCPKDEVLFEGRFHELHHEDVRDEVLRRVAQWTLADA